MTTYELKKQVHLSVSSLFTCVQFWCNNSRFMYMSVVWESLLLYRWQTLTIFHKGCWKTSQSILQVFHPRTV